MEKIRVFHRLLVSLGSLSFGLLFSWTSPSIPELINDKSKNITLEQASYFTVIPQITLILASPFYAYFLNKLGRKKLAVVIGVPQLLAWIVTGFADNIIWFYVARVLVGIGDAGMYTVLPLYIAEVSEPKIRGSWGTTLTFSGALGRFLVTAIGAYTSIKYTAAFGAIIAIVQIILTAFIPESPYYLLSIDKDEEAKKALSRLRWRLDTDEEIASLKADVNRQLSETSTYTDLITIKSNRTALLTAIGLRFAVQYSGVFAFQAYTQYMFQQAGGIVPDEIAASVYAFSTMLLTAFCGSISKKFGRRTLLIFSCVSCSIVLSAETIYFALRQFTDVLRNEWSWIPLFGMILYLIAAFSGIGFIPLLMQGELFSSSVKHKANAIMSVTVAINNIIVPKLFQALTYNLGMFAPFAIFSCCTMLSSIFCYMYVIETKGKTLEEIQQDLKHPRASIKNIR